MSVLGQTAECTAYGAYNEYTQKINASIFNRLSVVWLMLIFTVQSWNNVLSYSTEKICDLFKTERVAVLTDYILASLTPCFTRQEQKMMC